MSFDPDELDHKLPSTFAKDRQRATGWKTGCQPLMNNFHEKL